MTPLLLVGNVEFLRARPSDIARGLLGFVSLSLGETVEISNITLRRRPTGELYLAFPTREDKHGVRHSVARILDTDEAEAVTAQVIAILRAREAVR